MSNWIKLQKSEGNLEDKLLQGPRRPFQSGRAKKSCQCKETLSSVFRHLSCIFIADIYFIGLQLTWKKFRGIIGLLPREEWDVCLSERLQPDVRARIIRCKAQMEWFDFFSALHLGEHHYCHTDNLSPVLQALALPLPPWNLKKKLKRDCSKSSINFVSCYSIQYSQYVE